MFPIPDFFIATLLLFTAIPVSFAQEMPIHAQAKADALKDVDHDTKKGVLFTLGLVGSSAGFITGCVGGCVLGTLVDDHIRLASEDPLTNCGIPCSVLLGVLAVPTIAFTYPHNPNPSPERLLGKSLEYIEAYTKVYRSRTISLRKRSLIAGSLTSNLGVAGIILLSIISDQ